MSQFAITGTKVCAIRYEVIIEKAIASDNGRKRPPGMPVIVKAGANTARIQNKINSLEKAISRQASQMASDFGFPMDRCWCIFSMVTVDSSTRIPTANDKPLSVMILIV